MAGLANVAGGMLAVSRRGWDRVRQSFFVAAGAGFMLAAVLLRMTPESYRLAANHSQPGIAVGTLLLLGYLFVHAAEHVLVGHFHFGEETHHEHWVEPVVGTTALFGLLLHAFFAGVAIISLLPGLVRFALPFSAGAALYVAASDLIPAVNETKGIRMALWVFGGVILFYGTEAVLNSLGF